jgi:hypothetical protein
LVVVTTAPPQGLFLVEVEYRGRRERGQGRGGEEKQTEPE